MSAVARSIAGLTPAVTQDGRPHLDGAAALHVDGHTWAVAEERIVRSKHAGGSEMALRALLHAAGRTVDDIDAFYVSTCGESVPDGSADCVLSVSTGRTLRDLGVRQERVHWVPSHHLSHALAAWTPCDADRALVLVMDEAGSIPPSRSSGAAPEPERTTCYIAERGMGVRPILALTSSEHNAGRVGPMYRSTTDWLGMDGQRDCGKTMALAAYGYAGDVSHGVGRRKGDPFTREHLAVARVAQDELESATLDMVQSIIANHEMRMVCLSGGVALNCVLAGKILMDPNVDSVFVAPAPGDSGQAIGNCIWGASDGTVPLPEMKGMFLGPEYGLARVSLALRAWRGRYSVEHGDIAERVAQELELGRTVAVFHGRSEYGPRALGHRSIIADPCSRTMRDHLNRDVKHREWFRPYGVAVMEEAAPDIFGMELRSPAMMIALPLLPRWRRRLLAVAHVDGTSRVQTLAPDADPWMRKILEAFRGRTGTPAVLNTSFNRAGDPIVETPEDALAAFDSMGVDALAIEDYLLRKIP